MARGHPLLDVEHVREPLRMYLETIGTVFCAIEGHDSGHTSDGVRVARERWFVKHGKGGGQVATHFMPASAIRQSSLCARHSAPRPEWPWCTGGATAKT